jgi:hypothetical protein
VFTRFEVAAGLQARPNGEFGIGDLFLDLFGSIAERQQGDNFELGYWLRGECGELHYI